MSSRQIIPRSQAQPPFYVGIDLGGSSSKIGVVDDAGNTLSYVNVPTAIDQGPENGAERIGLGTLEALRQADIELKEVRRVGLGSPGTMDLATGMLIEPVNLPRMEQFSSPRSREPSLRPAGHLFQRRSGGGVRRVLARRRARNAEHGDVHTGNRHRLRHYCRRQCRSTAVTATAPSAGTL